MEVKKKITREVESVVGYKCNACGAEQEINVWEIKSGHCAWGNDSADSIEEKHACSLKCLPAVLEMSFKNIEGERTGWVTIESEAMEIPVKMVQELAEVIKKGLA